MKHEGLVDLIADAGALEAMELIGLREMRFQSGYVISKPPQSPQLFWHFDWGGWSHPISFEEIPVQDAAAYQELLRKADYAETVEAIRAGMSAHERGEGIDFLKAIEGLAARNGVSLKDD